MAKLKKVNSGQAFKFAFVFYLLIMGIVMLPMVGVFMISAVSTPEGFAAPFMGPGFGLMMIFVIPIYALSGALVVTVMTLLYNLVSGWVGGIEVEMEK